MLDGLGKIRRAVFRVPGVFLEEPLLGVEAVEPVFSGDPQIPLLILGNAVNRIAADAQSGCYRIQGTNRNRKTGTRGIRLLLSAQSHTGIQTDS